MELHYTTVTLAFVVLVLVICFVSVMIFLPMYWSGRGSPLFNTTGSISSTYSATTTHSTSSSYTGSILTTSSLASTPPPGDLKPKIYRYRVENGVIKVGIVFMNSYPVEVVIEKILLNDTIVFSGTRIIDSWSLLTKAFGEETAEVVATIWINTRIPGEENLLASGEMIYVGNITVHYKIPGVKGTYTKTFKLVVPETMIKGNTLQT